MDVPCKVVLDPPRQKRADHGHALRGPKTRAELHPVHTRRRHERERVVVGPSLVLAKDVDLARRREDSIHEEVVLRRFNVEPAVVSRICDVLEGEALDKPCIAVLKPVPPP